ncbi:MAG: hypothetical protein NTV33_09060, partial [Coprothermobacterota bacterium]|nr:hypothetical protein [Coprothermobacterota bacterium]
VAGRCVRGGHTLLRALATRMSTSNPSRGSSPGKTPNCTASAQRAQKMAWFRWKSTGSLAR